MTTFDTELQAQVDAQLMEQGAFAPLELLFNSGRLLYGDYESWRRGEIEALDGVLMGDPDKIRGELEQAVTYARGIGLVEQAQEYTLWASDSGTTGGKPLRVSADPKLHRLIASRYIPAQNAPQMDLFFDNPVVALSTGLVHALASRNVLESQRLLDRLYAQSPNHPDLPAFDQLLAALGHLHHPAEDPQEESDFLLKVGPAARRLLGPQSRDLLSPLWRQVAEAVRGKPFSADTPALHRSFALTQAQDWPGVAESVLSESRWWQHGLLCRRLVESALHRRRRTEALTAWCHLCWHAPEQATHAQEKLGQSDLAGWWRCFLEEESEGSDADESALTTTDFPAWLLLTEPGLAWQLPVDLPKANTPGEEHYRCVHRWIHAHRDKRQNEEIALRKALQANHPALFLVLKKSIGPV